MTFQICSNYFISRAKTNIVKKTGRELVKKTEEELVKAGKSNLDPKSRATGC